MLAAAERQAVPLSVSLELTLACNLRCAHCYNFDRSLPRHPDPARADEMTDVEIHRVIDDVRAEGALFLALTGGEPLAHPSLASFVRHAAGDGAFVRLKTNGALLTAGRAQALREAGLRAVDVSVYGPRARLHDPFVRKPGAFARTISGIRAARDAGLDVRMSLVVHEGNAAHLTAMTALARRLEVSYNVNTQLMARHDGSRSSIDMAVRREGLTGLYRGPLARFVGEPGAKRASIACPCARSVCGIGATGDVYPCIGAPLPAGNVRRQPFREIWRHSPVLNRIRGLTDDDFPACRSCEHRGHCRRTSGAMLVNTGSFTGPAAFGDDLCCVEAEVVHTIALERARAVTPPPVPGRYAEP
jgi:radical SAM protein with 4Fe4S-binding SPASM domain